jgi:hypothetical protein
MKRFGHVVEVQLSQNSFETLPIKSCQIVKNKNKLTNFFKKKIVEKLFHHISILILVL